VGKGHVLRGTVRSSADCAAIPGARVELWLAGPNGYDEDHRATLIADAEGRYRFESEMPGPFERRPPHIHVRVAHPGYEVLVTQQYPKRAAGGRDPIGGGRDPSKASRCLRRPHPTWASERRRTCSTCPAAALKT
jgi:protocatechuate 3,4-dioxygenase beta subunit